MYQCELNKSRKYEKQPTCHLIWQHIYTNLNALDDEETNPLFHKTH